MFYWSYFKQHQAGYYTTPGYYSKTTKHHTSRWHEIFVRLMCSHLEIGNKHVGLINVWAFSCYKISVCHTNRWIHRQGWKPFIMPTYLKFTLNFITCKQILLTLYAGKTLRCYLNISFDKCMNNPGHDSNSNQNFPLIDLSVADLWPNSDNKQWGN